MDVSPGGGNPASTLVASGVNITSGVANAQVGKLAREQHLRAKFEGPLAQERATHNNLQERFQEEVQRAQTTAIVECEARINAQLSTLQEGQAPMAAVLDKARAEIS